MSRERTSLESQGKPQYRGRGRVVHCVGEGLESWSGRTEAMQGCQSAGATPERADARELTEES